MKKILLFLIIAFTLNKTYAQFVYKIKADSVLITNDSCTAELNLENSTKSIKGFLYNKGNGRTEFRKGAVKLNDSMYLIGADTIMVGRSSGNFIINQNTAPQPASYWINGKSRIDNNLTISVPDTGASTEPYSYVHSPLFTPLRLGTNDAPITSINNYAMISCGRHYGAGIMVYDNLNSRNDCYGMGVTPYALQFYMPGPTGYPAYVTWNVRGYQPITGTNEIMRLKNNGNLMLGTSTDNGHKLQVTGNVIVGDNITDVQGNYIRMSGQSSFSELNVRSQTAGDLTLYGNPQNTDLTGHTGKTLYGQSNGIISGGYDNVTDFNLVSFNNMIFRTRGSEAFRISSSGNIGIGTTVPSAQLHTTSTVRFAGLTNDNTQTRVVVCDANGNLYYRNLNTWAANDVINSSLAVRGVLSAQKVKLMPQGWADYVFDLQYQLPTLTELEQYIRLHQHLPGVPAASEVAKNGIDVGDTQAVLLKKIEELTLYMIEKDKELKSLKQGVAELKNLVKAKGNKK